jgi:hypothetical protein
LAPHFLSPLAYLFHARMLLHRHNLLPRCSPNTRLAAVEGCTLVALDTGALIQRTSASLDDGATTLLAMHIFRCALFLLLTGYFEQGAVCIRALASISTLRDVAIPCGRYLSFFVSVLGPKRAEHADYVRRTRAPPSPRLTSKVPRTTIGSGQAWSARPTWNGQRNGQWNGHQQRLHGRHLRPRVAPSTVPRHERR